MRILGIDFGDKYTGIAISDPLCMITTPHSVIKRQNPIDVSDTIKEIVRLVSEYDVHKIVLGFPKNMDNSIGDRGEKTIWFKDNLEKKVNIPVILWDERLTTIEANRILTEGNVRTKNRKKHIDKTAAALILKGYIDFINSEYKKEKEGF